MRFFIALEIPEQNKQQIQDIQTNLKSLLPQVRLTNSDKLHLTIAFVGNQPANTKVYLERLIAESVKDIQPFTITPSYIDGFPNLHSAHTFWLGVKGDTDKLFILEERIRDGLSKLGIGTDRRRYTPHIAIAKISGLKLDQNTESKLQQLSLQGQPPITISSIKLFESVPNKGLHRHNTLAQILLQE